MKQRLCYTMTQVPDHGVSTVRVPAGATMFAGQVVTASTMDEAIAGNFNVRVPAAPTAETMASEICGVVVNGGFEELADGRRVDGQPDYTQYEFNENDVVTIAWLLPKVMVYMSEDCLADSSVSDVGDYIIPTAGSMVPTGTATKPEGATVKSYLKVLAKKSTRSGGQFGGGFINGSVCEAINQ